MAYMTVGQLHFKDYDKTAKEEGDNPHLTGFPDRALLARKEQYEVLAFINHIAKIHGWKADNGATGHKVEKMLRKMPGDIKGRQKAYECVKLNWNNS